MNKIKKLSILIPVFNEENTIDKVLVALTKIKLDIKTEIIVVDDGSVDETIKHAKKFIKKNKYMDIRLIEHARNLGKGHAMQTGFDKITGDYVLIQDADLEYDPGDIPLMLKKIDENKDEKKLAVFGSRFSQKNYSISHLYYLGNRALTMITNILFNTKLIDMETCYKLLPKEFVKKTAFTADRFDIEPEITAKLLKNGYKIIEVPISYKSRSRIAGKKITVKDGFYGILRLIQERFFIN